jgi:hypothetical protein
MLDGHNNSGNVMDSRLKVMQAQAASITPFYGTSVSTPLYTDNTYLHHHVPAEVSPRPFSPWNYTFVRLSFVRIPVQTVTFQVMA